MKTCGVIRTLTLLLLISGVTTVYAQESREEVPGDHFSLEGALELFKKSSSPEEFERLLNSADSEVNNLDLNGDGDIDYIKVIDRNEGNVHAFILQAIISERESQDVAVIELEKLANGKAVLQITGDADIYGIETIIEPTEEVRVNAGTSTSRTVVNVWAWPSVQYVYSPYYYGWVSPWHWSYRPTWWRPWRPVAYYSYYPRWESYRPYYSVCHTHRIGYAQEIYRPYRNTSVIVYNRHHTQISNYRSSRSSSDLYRGRDYADRGNSSSYQRNTSDRQRTVNTSDGNSRSSAANRRDYNTSGNRGRSSTTADNFSNGNRSYTDANRVPSGWQRNSDSMQKNGSERRSNQVNATPGSRQRDQTAFGNRSGTEVNRSSSTWQRNSGGIQRQDSESRQNHVNSNSGAQHRDTRQPSYDTRGAQRSVIQTERRGSSGSPDVGRSGNGNNGSVNKSGIQKRGRD
jgi:hypothetical protein